MSDLNLYERQRSALREWVALLEARALADTQTQQIYQAGRESADREIHRLRKTLSATRERERIGLDTDYQEQRQELLTGFESVRDQVQAEFDEKLRLLLIDADNARHEVRTQFKDAQWTLASIREANDKRAADQYEAAQRKVKEGRETLGDRSDSIELELLRYRLQLDEMTLPEERQAELIAEIDHFEKGLEASEAREDRIEQLAARKLPTSAGLFLLILSGAVLGGGWGVYGLLTKQPDAMIHMGIGLFVGVVIAGAFWFWQRSRTLHRLRQTAAEFVALREHTVEAIRHYEARKTERHAVIVKEILDKHAAESKRAEGIFLPRIAELDRQRAHDKSACEAHYQQLLASNKREYDERLHEATSRYDADTKRREREYDQKLTEAESQYEARLQELDQTRDERTQEQIDRWQQGRTHFDGVFSHLYQVGVTQFPEWDAVDWSKRSPITQVPEGVRFGRMEIDGRFLSDGITVGETLTVPAYLPFPDRGVLLMRHRDQGRAEAIQSLQAVMLRFLTGVPAGKVRFTIVDPVGLGDNFAAFMHLADYDEQLITSRIWTEPQQIEQRLEDLTAHMETVIQKYLRNQYRTIEEYNRQAGEVAEPFRVLVVANFPTNFTPEAARRLLSIASSGATCGVYTLISVDSRLAMPQGFQLKDLEQLALTFHWKDDRYVWKDAELTQFPVTLDTPPAMETITTIVQKTGLESRNAARVEVPFEQVAPSREQIWTADSRKGVSVPLGRAGATRKQLLALGSGTSQHVVIAGKTGSGKSTLLHALITNAALHYSPDELEMYLIDFKKGVEFKAYAANQLPHARVVAIESEREFGHSVLQRLDIELRTRGDRFRDSGCNDVNSYRNAHPNEKLPRILFIVDEFQEFFVADDKLSQESALLLDRLVRQGRAFGLHVLLGSQTLGGAYSLARSTIDQMAVRIALQCSDADAQLILSKDNSAARLLSRPGEAIYNDGSGALEANDLFQVVYLSDERREEWLEHLRQRADGQGFTRKPLVFEGNASADIEHHPAVVKWQAHPIWPESVKTVSTWLGDAIAIKDPTTMVFRPQAGANLLMVGQNEEAALGMMSAALISYAVQVPPSLGRVLLLDGTPPDDAQAGLLGTVAASFPLKVAQPDRSELTQVLGEWADEVKRRMAGGDRTPCLVLIQGLQRFRDLRKGDEDFSFGRRGAGERTITAAEHFATLFREGPTVGIHVMAWCDSLSNVQRVLDRPALREFGYRVLFQMSAADSSNLIDTPIASRLGRHRALFFHDELEQPEKFRPYGLVSLSWLREMRERMPRDTAVTID